MSSNAHPVIIAARRTPHAPRGRALSGFAAHSLAAATITASLEDARRVSSVTLPPIGDVVLGNCMGPGGNPARIAALAAGLGTVVPGQTIDRQCGSGLAAILNAGNAIAAGDNRTHIAGGVESPSTAPVRSYDGAAYSRAPFTPDGFADPDMTFAAELLAKELRISRERQDAHAWRSLSRARKAAGSGRFDREIVRVGDVASDAMPTSTEKLLARMPPLFDGGTVTAGTSSRVGDGAASVVIAPPGTAKGLAIIASAVVGCDPELPGIGAAGAITAALDNAGCSLSSIAAFEIVEAFSAQSLAVLQQLGLADDDERVCSDGGSLALGHPWGASGAIAIVRLFSRLVGTAEPGTRAIAAASIGGGMGIACVVEVVA